MKKALCLTLALFIELIIFSACTQNSGSQFLGDWRKEGSPSCTLNISKQGNNFIISITGDNCGADDQSPRGIYQLDKNGNLNSEGFYTLVYNGATKKLMYSPTGDMRTFSKVR